MNEILGNVVICRRLGKSPEFKYSRNKQVPMCFLEVAENMENAGYKISSQGYTTGELNQAQPLFENLIWLTTEEAARFLRKSCHALRQMVYKGQIKARKFRGRLYFKKSELHELIDTSFY